MLLIHALRAEIHVIKRRSAPLWPLQPPIQTGLSIACGPSLSDLGLFLGSSLSSSVLT